MNALGWVELAWAFSVVFGAGACYMELRQVNRRVSRIERLIDRWFITEG